MRQAVYLCPGDGRTTEAIFSGLTEAILLVRWVEDVDRPL